MEEGRLGEGRTCWQVIVAVVFAELAGACVVDGRLEAGTSSPSSVVEGFVRHVHAVTAADLHDGRLHAEGRPSPYADISVDQFLSFLQLMLAVLLSLDVVVLDCFPVDHYLKAACTDLHWRSKDDPL